MPASGIRLHWLHEIPDCSPVLAQWHADAFGAWLGGWTAVEALGELKGHRTPGLIPCTLVATVEGEVAGSVSALSEDPPAPAGMGPWFASFYVHPPWRNSGVGGALHDRINEAIRDLGYSQWRLWTSGNTAFYRKRGWEETGRISAHGYASVIMTRRLFTTH